MCNFLIIKSRFSQILSNHDQKKRQKTRSLNLQFCRGQMQKKWWICAFGSLNSRPPVSAFYYHKMHDFERFAHSGLNSWHIRAHSSSFGENSDDFWLWGTRTACSPVYEKLGLCDKAIFKKFHTVCKKLANGEHSDRPSPRLVYEKPWLLRDFRFEGPLIRRTDSYLL